MQKQQRSLKFQMNPTDKLAQSIDNGLAIAEFIQENRSNISAKSGRIGITKGDINSAPVGEKGDKKKSSESNIGQKRKFASTSKSTEGKSSQNNGPSDDNEGTIHGVRLNESIFIGPGNDHVGYVRDLADPTSREQLEATQDLLNDEGRSFFDTEGKEESEESNEHAGDHVEHDGRDDRSGDNQNAEADNQGPRPESNSSIGLTTQEVLNQVMEETNPVPKRRLRSAGSIQDAANKIPPPTSVIKKTTDENTLSQRQQTGRTSKVGATHNVHQSPSIQDGIHVNVENAPSDATSVMMTDNTDDRERGLEDASLIRSSLEKKIDAMLDNQEKILKKLDQISEIKEEINAIKKTLANQSLALSTVESYIGEMMIIIPKSGNPQESDTNGVTKNPDLRPVIGRDSNRGKKEVTRGLSTQEKIDVGEDFYSVPVADEKYLPTPINNRENNAANFVPTEDKTSYKIIREIIRKQMPDIEAQNEVMKLLDENIGKVPIKELYNGIKEIIFADIDY
uniref:Phosphoprotein n=1 Tax=Bat paramyxovirus TaxID=1300978 RepID=A0A5K6W862_9MONO|nr:phosphoprotein [Bat paramyxovirus]